MEKRHEELREKALQHMREGVDSVIGGEVESFETKLVSISDVREYIKTLGWTTRDDFDSNGWQADMWESFENQEYDKVISLYAEGYYGGVCVELDEKE